MLRLSGGEWKGQSLHAPRHDDTRPTSSATREALFNILENGRGHEVKRVLDLFAGTGALGFEALSRGAESVVWIEKDKEAQQCIRKNMEKFKVSSRQGQLITDAKIERWPELLRDGAPYDTIFCDPPYGRDFVERTLKAFAKARELLAPGALFIAEFATRDAWETPEGWKLEQERERGDTVLRFLSI